MTAGNSPLSALENRLELGWLARGCSRNPRRFDPTIARLTGEIFLLLLLFDIRGS
jgi:hypothetical protein